MGKLELRSSSDGQDLYDEVLDFLLLNGFNKVDENERRVLLRKLGGENKVRAIDTKQLARGNKLQLWGALAILLFLAECAGSGIVGAVSEGNVAVAWAIMFVLLLMGVAFTISAFVFKSNARKVDVVKEDDTAVSMQRGEGGVIVDVDDATTLEVLSARFGTVQ